MNETIVAAATAAIVAAAAGNPCITAASLMDEAERGDIDGWLGLAAVRACCFAEWTAAMYRAAYRLPAVHVIELCRA